MTKSESWASTEDGLGSCAAYANAAWRSEAEALAVARSADTFDDGVDAIAVALGVLPPLQDDCGDAFTERDDGQQAVALGDKDPEVHFELASALRASGQSVNSINLAILAALTFADELERLRRDHQALISHLETLSERLSAAIDGHE